MYTSGLLTKEAKLVFVSEPKNYTGAAATTEWISMKNYDKIMFVIQTGSWAGGTAAVTLNQSTDVSNSLSDSKAVSFTKMYTNDGATSTDTLTETAVGSNTFNLDTANALYVIEVRASMLDVSNGFDCVSIAVASPGVNADLYSILAVCYNPRITKGTASPSAIVD